MTYQYVTSTPAVVGGTMSYRSAPTTSSFRTSTSTTSISVPTPTGIQPGDLLLVFVAAQFINDAGYDSTMTLLASNVADGNGSGAMYGVVYYRIVDGTEESTLTASGYNFTGSAVGAAVCIAIQGAASPWNDGGEPPLFSSDMDVNDGCVVPSITLSDTGDWLVGFFAYAGAGMTTSPANTITPPSGFTEQVSVASENWEGYQVTAIAADIESGLTAGPTGAKTATAAEASTSCGYIIGVRPENASHSLGTVTIDAPAGTSVIGGGFSVNDGFTAASIKANGPVDEGGSWAFSADFGTLQPGDQPVTVTAICADAS